MDRQKLEEELQRLHQQSFGWALRCTYEDADAAAEVLQNTYLKVLENKAKFRERSGFRTWLFSVIRLTALDHLRHRQKARLLPLEKENAYLTLPDETAFSNEAEQQQAIFRQALAQLSPQQQALLHLVFYQDCTIQEAAEILQMQLGTARTHYQRGKEQVKKWLIKAGFSADTAKNK